MSDPSSLMMAALISRAGEAPALAGAVFDSRPTPGTVLTKYAVLYLQRTPIYERAGSAEVAAWDWLLTVHVVNKEALGVRAMASAVADVFAGYRLVVDGWRSSKLRLIHSQPIDFDATVQPPVAFGVEQYSWRSDAM